MAMRAYHTACPAGQGEALGLDCELTELRALYRCPSFGFVRYCAGFVSVVRGLRLRVLSLGVPNQGLGGRPSPCDELPDCDGGGPSDDVFCSGGSATGSSYGVTKAALTSSVAASSATAPTWALTARSSQIPFVLFRCSAMSTI